MTYNNQFVLSQLGRSEVWHQGVSRVTLLILFWDTLEENPSCLFQVAPGIPWLVVTSLPSLPLSSHGLLLLCLSSLLRLLVRFRTHRGKSEWSHLKVHNSITSLKTLFPNKVTFTDSGVLTYLLGSHHSIHYKDYIKIRLVKFQWCPCKMCLREHQLFHWWSWTEVTVYTSPRILL